MRTSIRNLLHKAPYLRNSIRKIKNHIILSSLLYRKMKSYLEFPINSDSNKEGAIVLGNRVISKDEWETRKDVEITKKRQEIPSYRLYRTRRKFKDEARKDEYSTYEISVIVSVYRPGLMFDSLLGNIYEQTIFSRAEVILVLVDPLDSEMIEAQTFAIENPNVVLQVVESRITIYEAWNLAVKASSAALITNMNVDDLRSNDSLEIQVKYMKSHPWTDVGYQDVYFMLDRDLDWASVVNIGAKSKLFAVTLIELAWFGINPPHNGPVWKRELHSRYGLFDETLKSAGDYEFWMRIATAKSVFTKMPKSTVGYFMNPMGMSTSQDSPSTEEERALQEKYRKKVELRSEVMPEIGLNPEFLQHPWDGSESLTELVLTKLREVSLHVK